MKKMVTFFVIISLMIVVFAFGEEKKMLLNVISVTPQVQIYENSITSPIFKMILGVENVDGVTYLKLRVQNVQTDQLAAFWSKSKLVVGDQVYAVNYKQMPNILIGPSQTIDALIKVPQQILMSSNFTLWLPFSYNNDTLNYKITLKIFAPKKVKLFKPKDEKNIYLGLETLTSQTDFGIGGRVNLWNCLEIGYHYMVNLKSNALYSYLNLLTSGSWQWYAGVGIQTEINNWKNFSFLGHVGNSLKILRNSVRFYGEADYNISKSTLFFSGGIQYGF